LSRECDLYEERIGFIDKDIGHYEKMANMNNSELKKKVIDMGEEAEDLKKQILLNTEEVDEV